MPPRPRSIAIITSLAFSIANFRGALIRELVAAGIRVYCLAPDFDVRTRGAVLALGAEPVDISLQRTGMQPLRDVMDMLRLARLLRRLKPDVTFGYFIKAVVYGTPAAWLAGIRHRHVLVPGLGYVFTEAPAEPWRRRLLRWMVGHLYRVALRFAQVVFFQNSDDRDHFVAHGIVARDKGILLAGSGVDIDAFTPRPLPSGAPVFLLVARLLREKGVIEFVEAARLLRAETTDVRCVLAGGPDPNPGGISVDTVREWVAQGDIEWLGHVDDIRTALSASSVFVLPSYREGKPRSTQEAMAMGRAVVTTDAPGCRDTVAEGVNGFKVPLRDAHALAAAMRRFIKTPSLMETMGAASRQMAVETYDVHRINAMMLAAMAIETRHAFAQPSLSGGTTTKE